MRSAFTLSSLNSATRKVRPAGRVAKEKVKTYDCEACGASFKTPLEKARHVKQHKE